MGRLKRRVSVQPVLRSILRRANSLGAPPFVAQKLDTAMGKRAVLAQSLVRVAGGAAILSFERINYRRDVVLDHSLIGGPIPGSKTIGVKCASSFSAAFAGDFDAHFRI